MIDNRQLSVINHQSILNSQRISSPRANSEVQVQSYAQNIYREICGVGEWVFRDRLRRNDRIEWSQLTEAGQVSGGNVFDELNAVLSGSLCAIESRVSSFEYDLGSDVLAGAVRNTDADRKVHSNRWRA
jgi:hypothetical protein